MDPRNPRPRSIADRLDAMRFEWRAGLAELRAEFKTDIAELRTELKSDIAALAGDFREFKGTVKSAAIVIATLVPLVTAVAVVAANFLTKHLLG